MYRTLRKAKMKHYKRLKNVSNQRNLVGKIVNGKYVKAEDLDEWMTTSKDLRRMRSAFNYGEPEDYDDRPVSVMNEGIVVKDREIPLSEMERD